MEVDIYEDEDTKMYSDGIETGYSGKSIIYDDTKKTFVYYYYINHQRMYVIDGKKDEVYLPNIKEAVRIITVYEDRQVKVFKKYLKSIIKNKTIFSMGDDFFLELKIMLTKKSVKFVDILSFYTYYTEKGKKYEYIERKLCG